MILRKKNYCFAATLLLLGSTLSCHATALPSSETERLQKSDNIKSDYKIPAPSASDLYDKYLIKAKGPLSDFKEWIDTIEGSPNGPQRLVDFVEFIREIMGTEFQNNFYQSPHLRYLVKASNLHRKNETDVITFAPSASDLYDKYLIKSKGPLIEFKEWIDTIQGSPNGPQRLIDFVGFIREKMGTGFADSLEKSPPLQYLVNAAERAKIDKAENLQNEFEKMNASDLKDSETIIELSDRPQMPVKEPELDAVKEPETMLQTIENSRKKIRFADEVEGNNLTTAHEYEGGEDIGDKKLRTPSNPYAQRYRKRYETDETAVKDGAKKAAGEAEYRKRKRDRAEQQVAEEIAELEKAEALAAILPQNTALSYEVCKF